MKFSSCFGSLVFCFIISLQTKAQPDSTDAVFTFRITDYILPVSESVSLVQISIPDVWPVRIPFRQTGILKKIYRPDKEFDTTIAGWGRCHMIKENWYYFSINKMEGHEPARGDLLVTKCRVLTTYSGIFFDLLRFGISLTRVDENQFFNSGEVFLFKPGNEEVVLDSMIADIRFTAEVMISQKDNQDFLISKGPFSGKKIFAVLTDARRTDLQNFLNYVRARPSKYAGNSWKISEIFATWVYEGAPMIISAQQ